jgi:hypothetical protein
MNRMPLQRYYSGPGTKRQSEESPAWEINRGKVSQRRDKYHYLPYLGNLHNYDLYSQWLSYQNLAPNHLVPSDRSSGQI